MHQFRMISPSHSLPALVGGNFRIHHLLYIPQPVVLLDYIPIIHQKDIKGVKTTFH